MNALVSIPMYRMAGSCFTDMANWIKSNNDASSYSVSDMLLESEMSSLLFSNSVVDDTCKQLPWLPDQHISPVGKSLFISFFLITSLGDIQAHSSADPVCASGHGASESPTLIHFFYFTGAIG